MKSLIMAGLILSLTGCGWFDRELSKLTGAPSKVCVDGVTYLMFTTGTSPLYTIDGKLVACK